MFAMPNNIKSLLTQKGWSIYELHKKAGLTYNATHSLVRADKIPDGTSYGTLKRVARALGVKIDDLETEDTNEAHPNQ